LGSIVLLPCHDLGTSNTIKFRSACDKFDALIKMLALSMFRGFATQFSRATM
jgi:hypothetical protein